MALVLVMVKALVLALGEALEMVDLEKAEELVLGLGMVDMGKVEELVLGLGMEDMGKVEELVLGLGVVDMGLEMARGPRDPGTETAVVVGLGPESASVLGLGLVGMETIAVGVAIRAVSALVLVSNLASPMGSLITSPLSMSR